VIVSVYFLNEYAKQRGRTIVFGEKILIIQALNLSWLSQAAIFTPYELVSVGERLVSRKLMIMLFGFGLVRIASMIQFSINPKPLEYRLERYLKWFDLYLKK
jgi:hypothetical protein